MLYFRFISPLELCCCFVISQNLDRFRKIYKYLPYSSPGPFYALPVSEELNYRIKVVHVDFQYQST